MFPFGRDSNGAKSIIEYLSSNHNYKTRITSDGKFLVHNQFHFYPIFSSGTVIYKIQDVQMRHGEAQADVIKTQKMLVFLDFFTFQCHEMKPKMRFTLIL